MSAQHTPEAEKLADCILKASGSALRNYSMAKTREAIFTAAQFGLDSAAPEIAAERDQLKKDLEGERVFSNLQFDQINQLKARNADLESANAQYSSACRHLAREGVKQQ